MRDLLYGALSALMIAAAACGGGDPPGGGNGNGDTDGGNGNGQSSDGSDEVSEVRCGDETCTPATDSTLTEDCGCASDQTCRSWGALGLSVACGQGLDRTRYCGSACGSSNPLIDAIPGLWHLESRNGMEGGIARFVHVDPSLPTCDWPDQEAGDACVVGEAAGFLAVLSGARLFLGTPPASPYLEGQVTEEGRRIEYDLQWESLSGYYVWVKME